LKYLLRTCITEEGSSLKETLIPFIPLFARCVDEHGKEGNLVMA